MATPFDRKNGKGVGASLALGDSAKDDESHVEGFTPMMLARYKRVLELVLMAPWEGVCKHRTCNCDPPLPVKLKTCWDTVNRGSRVIKCGNSAEHGCGYKSFVSRGIMGPDPNTMDFLYDRVKRLVAANVILKAKLAAFDDASNTLWVREETPDQSPCEKTIDDKAIFTDADVIGELYPCMVNK